MVAQVSTVPAVVRIVSFDNDNARKFPACSSCRWFRFEWVVSLETMDTGDEVGPWVQRRSRTHGGSVVLRTYGSGDSRGSNMMSRQPRRGSTKKLSVLSRGADDAFVFDDDYHVVV